MVNFKFLTRTMSIIFMLICSFTIKAQLNEQPKGNFEFRASNVNYVPLKIRNMGLDVLNSRITPNYEFGISYAYLIKKNWGLRTGISISNVSRNINMHFQAESDIYFINTIQKYSFNSYHLLDRITLPLSTYKLFRVSESLFINTELGLNFDLVQNNFSIVNFITYYDDVTNTSTPFFKAYFENPYANYALFLSYTVKVGLRKYFKNKDYFGVNFIACHSPSAIGVGRYEFYNMKEESKGLLEWRASYFGLEFTYGLKNKKKKNLSRNL